jgi:hypothetical protein
MRKIRVMTNDPYLWQKIYLILKKEYEPIRAEAVGDDVTLVDIDAYPNESGGIRMSRESECELAIPFSDEMLFAAIGGDDKRAARLTLDGRTAHLDGEDIRLTEVEAALLSRLMREGGGFVERGVLLSDVWGEVADGGLAGTTGESRRVEAVRIRLTGEASEHLSVWYRVHSRTFGWLDWTRDGTSAAGTEGLAKRAEAVEVVLLPKDAAAPGPTDTPFVTNG